MQGYWNHFISLVITAVVLPFVTQWLRAQAQAAHAKAKDAQLDTRTRLAYRLQEFLDVVAGAVAEKNFPGLAESIKAGHLTTKDDVKATLYQWRDDLMKEAVDHFKAQGVDLNKELGEAAIDRLIQIAANKASPFPGVETAGAILKPGMAELLLEKGVHATKEITGQCKACVPPCDECPLKG